MSDSLLAQTGDQHPTVARSSTSEDDRLSPTRGTPNFSRPLPFNPSRGFRSETPPANTTIRAAQTTTSTSSSPRPLPSLPPAPSRSPEHSQGGRGSGLGTRIIDDRDPDDLVPPPLLAQTQGPSHSPDEDERTSTAASDSELLYASAPSSPLHVPGELEQEGNEKDRTGDRGSRQHEAPGRRATVALGEDHRDRPESALTPKRAATADYGGRKSPESRLPVPQVHEGSQVPQRSNTGLSVSSIGSSEDLNPYLRRIMEHFGDESEFPSPLAEASASSFSEPHGRSSESETPALSMPSAISFPTPSHDQHHTSWTTYSSSTIHAAQAPGDPVLPSNPSQPPAPSVIAGTNLEFEPLPPPYKRTASPEPLSKHAEMPTPTHRTLSRSRGHRPLPTLPPQPSTSSPRGQGLTGRVDNDSLGSTPITETSNGTAFSGTGIASTAPLRISKHSRIPSSYPSIPPGAAAPTPPASSSSPDLPKKLQQESSVKASLPPSPPSHETKGSLSDSSTIATPPTRKPASIDDTAIAKPGSRPTNTGRIPSAQSTSPPEDSAPPSQGAPLPASSKQLKPALKRNISANGGSTSHAQEAPETDAARISTRAANSGERKEGGPSAVKEEAQLPGSGKQAHGNAQPRRQSQTQETQTRAQDPVVQRQSQSGLPGRRLESQAQSSRPSDPPPPPSRPKPSLPSDPYSVTTPSAARRRDSHAESSSHQPRTLAEEKAQYNAIPPSSRSQYMNMLLALDDIPTIYNISASFFTWILLAGFVLFPGTFTSLETLDLGDSVGAALVDRIVNLPLFVVAFICTGIGIIGMGYLWWKWMKNYIWLVNKIFLPGLMNSLAGVISTLVNVYGVQHGEFNTTSIVTISVTGGVGVACGLLVLWYGVWLLGRVKKRHAKEMGVEKAGKHGEGVWAGFKEKVGNAGKRK